MDNRSRTHGTPYTTRYLQKTDRYYHGQYPSEVSTDFPSVKLNT